MVDDSALREWFCGEVLPLEPSLSAFIRRNWREAGDVVDLRQDIYERVLAGARHGLPQHTPGFVYTVARNHLINCAKRAQIVSFQLVADLEEISVPADMFSAERHLQARDELRRAQTGLERLPPRCREVVRLRKVEGLSTREVSDRLGIGVDTVEKQMTLGMRALADFMLGGTGKVERASLRERLGRRRRQ